MTTLHTAPDPRLDLTRQALRHAAESWQDGLGAALDHDARAARRVMRGAAARRSMLRAAHQHHQWDEGPRDRPATHRSSAEVVADLVRINRMLNELAQTVIAAPGTDPLPERERANIDTARRIGSRRLWRLADSMPRPLIDREYILAGHDLLDAMADLAESAPRRGTTADVCLGLMITLVEASRHATRIA